MLSFIVNKYKNSKGLVNYFFLTYLDKIISFALPLSILLLLKDKQLYSFVEVCFSYATLAMIIVELGVSNYLFYGYKNSSDQEHFLRSVLLNFKFLLLVYLLLSAAFLCVVKAVDQDLLVLFALVGIRTLFTLYLSFFSNIFRLQDNPSGIYITSLLVNVLSFILLLLAHVLSLSHKLLYFFLPSFLLLLFVVLKFILTEIRRFQFSDFIVFMGSSLRFSWPIIINVLAMSYINNYAKIYAYGHLSQDQMVQISYIMRIGMIIQLTHSSFASYFSKSIFMDSGQELNMRIFKRYQIILLLSTLLVFVIMLSTNFLFADQIQIPLTLATFLFLSYILIWCYIGYLEIYFGIKNANRMVLYFSIISSLIYTALVKFSGEISIFQLALYMVISAVFNLILVLIGLNQLKVINLKRSISSNKHKA